MKPAFARPPDQVTTTTDSGKTVIQVPQGSYNIVAATDSGHKNIKAAWWRDTVSRAMNPMTSTIPLGMG